MFGGLQYTNVCDPLTKFQNEILEIMSIGSSIKEVRALMPEVFQRLKEYKHMLKDKIIPIEELAFSKRRSRDFNEYDRNTAFM